MLRATQKIVGRDPANKFRDEAIEKYKEAINIDKNYYPAYYNWAVAHYIRTGDKVEANKLYLKGEEAQERYKEAKERYLVAQQKQYLVAQQNKSSPVLATSQKTVSFPPMQAIASSEPFIPRLFWPWAGGIVALLAGLLVIFFSGVPDKLKKTFDITPSPQPVGPTVTPGIDKTPVSEEKKSTPQRRRTQVERVSSH